MKLYLAGGGGRLVEGLFNKANASYRLLSYYSCYAGRKGKALKDRLSIINPEYDYFLDSGAYSARASGASINIKDYYSFIKTYGNLFTIVTNLDVGNYAECEANQKYLEKSGIKILPVFHYQDFLSLKYRRKIEKLCQNYEYVALGGVAGSITSGKVLDIYLSYCFKFGLKYKTKFHGFGMTSAYLLSKFPFYSVDSTSWNQGGQYGKLSDYDKVTNKQIHYSFKDSSNVSRILKTGLNIKQIKNYKERDLHNMKSYVAMGETITKLWKLRGIYWNK